MHAYMVEKIARALCQKCLDQDPGGWDVDRDWDLFREDAEIALSTMALIADDLHVFSSMLRSMSRTETQE